MRSTWLWRIVLSGGIALVLLGALWFLQGSDVVHIEPVLCAGDCRPITGRHPGWQVAGGCTAAVGAVTSYLAGRRLRRASR